MVSRIRSKRILGQRRDAESIIKDQSVTGIVTGFRGKTVPSSSCSAPNIAMQTFIEIEAEVERRKAEVSTFVQRTTAIVL